MIDTHRPHCQEWVQDELDEMRADAVVDQERRERRYGPEEDEG